MSDIAIQVENLSKQYTIGAAKYRHDTLRDQLMDGLKSVFRWNDRPHPGRETIWALKDVSFEVKQGETLGIIGRNGAGKSTLLKILSRITEPTRGTIRIRSRLSSLLEVGTGFHPELTGRENILLNGAILGMHKAEIASKFDEIVDFSGVEKFIDTPVKRYSSGMYVRLAFAVAAHLEPEILLVDEVLAVGDAAFQKKCLGKMSNVAAEGRTIVFVSHNMAAVQALCSRVLLFDDGQLVASGPSEDTILRYLAMMGATSNTVDLAARTDREGDGRLHFTSLAIQDGQGNPLSCVASGQSISFAVGYEVITGNSLNNIDLSVIILDPYRRPLISCATRFVAKRFDLNSPKGCFYCRIPSLPLVPDRYIIDLWSASTNVLLDYVKSVDTLHVVEGDFFGSGQLPRPKHGPMLFKFDWSVVDG